VPEYRAAFVPGGKSALSSPHLNPNCVANRSTSLLRLLETDTLNWQRLNNQVSWENSDNMSSQHIPSNLLYSVVSDDQHHVFARVRYSFVSWYAWCLERSTSSDVDLAHGHAGAFSGAQNLG